MPEAGRTAARFDKRGVAFCAVAVVLLLSAGVAGAVSSHDPWKLREVRVDAVPIASAVGQCDNCHTLDTTMGDTATSYINRNARTLPQMRAFGGVPVSFGCTFCHSGVTDNIYMRNALKDYEFTPSNRKHPVGVNVAGTNNNNEYFSTFDSAVQVDQLQCLDCHEAALLLPGGMTSYPYHEGRTGDAAPWTGGWNKAVNPFALRNVAALGDERRNHCVSTCHGNLGAANGATKPRMGHLGWGGYNGTTLFEPRGQALLQSNCGVCHDAHSSTQDLLMGDGLTQQTTGVNPAPPPDLLRSAEAAINMSDCTLACHIGRDPASDYRTKGHGKPRNREDTLNMAYSYTGCTPCHTSSVRHRDPANPKRFGFTENTTMAVLSHNGSTNGRDDDYDGQVDEADEAAWTQPAVSICQGCHSTYNTHGGEINLAAPHLVSASCLDCHDPHGKGVGANIEMIRTTIAGEPTTFQNTGDMGVLGDDDFYRNWGGGDRTGVCDNTACHGRDLAAILADPDINDHVGVAAGDNCTGCHTHTGGGASFKPKCDLCHGYPPATGGLPDYSQGIGVHRRHVTDLLIPCSECHFRNGALNNTHNEDAWEEPRGIPVPRGQVDVVFNTHGGTVNVSAAYSGYNVGTGTMDNSFGTVHTCTNITCHNPDSSTTGLTGKAGAPTNNIVSWADAVTPINACTGCHVQSPAGNPDGGSHYKHDNSTGGKGYPCQTCHSSYYDATNTFGTAAGNHSNRLVETTGIVNISGTLGNPPVPIGGSFDDGNNTCSAVYCHGDGAAPNRLNAGGDQLQPVWGPGASRSGGRCGDCHNTDPTTDTFAPQDYMATGNHSAHLNAPQGPNVTCAACHPAYALNAVNHADGEKDFLNIDNSVTDDLAATDTCTNCHGSSVANAKNATNWANGSFRLGCLECHDGTARSARIGGVLAPQQNLYWTATGHGRTTGYNATRHGQNGPGYACTICHDQNAPHISGSLGDTERFQSVADDALDHTSDTSEVCLDCHRVGQTVAPSPPNHLGRDAVAEASVHSGALTGNFNTLAKAGQAFPAYGEQGNYLARPGYQCEACHNPHGTSKLAMVKDTLNGMFGVVPDSNPVAVGAAFDSGNTTLTGLDPTAGTNDGVCDACHRSSGNTNAHPDSAKVNNHNHLQNCVTCHDHRNSFFAGCSDCHGGSLVGTTRRNYWPDGAAGPDTAGAHAGHVADLAQRIYGLTVAALLNDAGSDAKQKHICKYCHGTNPGNDADHGYTANLPAEVTANLGRIWDTADPPALTDAIVYNVPAGSRTCASVECHYNTTTPGWLSGTAATCTTCHNNGTNNGLLINAWPDIGAAGTGDHFAHFAALGAEFTAVYGANNVCLACHNTQQPATDFSNIVSVASHMDGDRYGDTGIPSAFNDKSEGTTDVVAYTPGVTPNENNGTCANVSCHGGSAIGATPAWRDGVITTTTVTTAECQRCHQRVDGNTNPLGTEYNDARSGAHVHHDHGCATCHSAVPTAHYAGIATVALDNPNNIANPALFASYADSTATAVNPLTNGWFNDATTAGGVSGTCNTVTCHNNASPAWDVDLTASCGLCHLDSPVTNSHPAHIYNGATPDHTDCDQCHPSAGYAVAASGTHASFLGGTHATGVIAVNLVAGIGATGSGGTVACATACHARETTTTWNNTTVPMTCNSCHYYAAAPTAAGNGTTVAGYLGDTHDAHFYGAPTNIVCADCHVNPTADTAAKRTHMRNTGATDGAILQNKAVASQDEADVLASVMNASGDPDQPPIGVDVTSNPTCNAALCHNPSPGAAYSAIWTGPANSSCNFCHADAPAGPATGSHARHTGYASGYAPCAQCHVDNGTTYAHMTRQVDLAAGLAAGYTAALTPPYTAATFGSCSAGACHDTDQDPAWGSAVPANSCGVCHVNNNAVPASSTDLPNFSGSDRVASRVGIGAEWSVRGHGAKAGPVNQCTGCHDGSGVPHQPDLAASGNPFRLGPGYTNPDAFCSNTTSCHTGATVPGSNLVVSHTDELMNVNIRQRTWPSWNPKCVDCHDPHGDGANLKMVSTDVFDRGSSTHGVPTATVNGVPRTTDVVDFTVQGDIAAGSYAQTPGADGVCQECHMATDGVATGLLSFQDDNPVALAGLHPTTNLAPCTQCHKHDKAFEPAGCNGCHGSTVTRQFWPDGAGGAPPYVDDRGDSGSHDAHILVISQYLYGQTIAQLLADAASETRQKTICAFCHPDPGGTTHTVNAGAGVYANRVDVWFDGQNDGGTGSNYFQVFKVGAGITGNDAGTNGTYDPNTLRCSNVDCHYKTPTPAYGGLGWNGGASGSPNCESCHFYRDGAGYPTRAYAPGTTAPAFPDGDLPDAHSAHVSGIASPNPRAGKAYLCTYCHSVAGYTTAHTDGQIQISTAGNPTLNKDGNPTDEVMSLPSTAVKQGLGAANTTCTNLYCHGADFGGAADGSGGTRGTNIAPVWNNHTTGTCGTCHDVDTEAGNVFGQPLTQGSHGTHQAGKSLIAWGPGLPSHANRCAVCHGWKNDFYAPAPSGCTSNCHYGTGTGSTPLPGNALDAGFAWEPSRSHVEGNFEIDFEGRTRGWNDVMSEPYAAGVLASLAATDICDRCHSTWDPDGGGAQLPGVAVAKANWATAARITNCQLCHNASALPGYSTPVSGGTVASDKVTNYAGFGHGKVTPTAFGGNACADCHAENSQHIFGGVGQQRLNPVNGQDYTTGANAFCASACHGIVEPVHYPDTKTPGGGSDDAVLCSTCHGVHGLAGQDAMIRGTVAGRPVSGFTNKGLRASYFNAGNTGICQVCHAPAEVNYYNRTSGATDTHNPGVVCISCHAHNDTIAFKPNCNNCHGDVPGMAVPRGDGSSHPPEGPTAARNPGGLNWAETTSNLATVGDHQSHTNYASCPQCHTTTPGLGVTHDDLGTNATMTEIVGWGSWNPGPLAGVASVVDDYCTVTCHNNLGFPGIYSPANPAYVRYWNSNWDCYACHAYDGAADSPIRPGDQTTATADWMASGSHNRHINRSTGYSMVCTECHVNNAGNNAHRNGSVSFAANFGATRLGANLGGAYDANGVTPFVNLAPPATTTTQQAYCGNVYCHSTGEPRGAEALAYRATTRWANAATGACGTCHAVDGVLGTTMTTNVHEKHTATGQYGIQCQICHNGVVSYAAGYTVSNRTLHVNYANEAVFAANEGTYNGGVFPAGGTCTATYCHSQGLDWTGPYTMAAANAPTIPPDWDSAAGSLACVGCHGNGATIAYPVYANDSPVDPGGGIRLKKNSHDKHSAYTCNFCHSATVNAANAIIAPNLHTDKIWQVAQGGTATFTVSILGNMTGNNYTATRCATISCHNGGTADWGATLQCSDCHFAAADIDNWNIADGTASAISPTEWTTTGHGRTTSYPPATGGNGPAAFAGPAAGAVPDVRGCAYCHSFVGTAENPLVLHGVAGNPFRLANRGVVGTVADQWNQACLTCHSSLDSDGYDPDGGSAGYAPRNGSDVNENHYGTKHGALTQGGAFCWDCHDPHGDANHLMIHSGDGSAAGRGVTSVSDGVYGVPQSSRSISPAIDLTSGGYTSGDLANAGNTGLCQTCHASSGGANYYTRSLFTPLANHKGADGTLCTECHPHGRDFAPRTCESCHNIDTPYVKGTATAPNVMGNGTSAVGTGGASPKPYDDGSFGFNVNGHGRDDTPNVPGNTINVPCEACHDLGLPAGTHLDGTINGRLTPTDTRTANSFHLLSAFIRAAPTSQHDVQVTFDNACATLCHGAGIAMRHAIDAVPAANAVQFGTHNSYSEPQNAPPPIMFYDRHLKSAATFGGYDGAPNFALCVSCHNPHGTNTPSPRADANNKMMLYPWSNPSTLCAQCHP